MQHNAFFGCATVWVYVMTTLAIVFPLSFIPDCNNCIRFDLPQPPSLPSLHHPCFGFLLTQHKFGDPWLQFPSPKHERCFFGSVRGLCRRSNTHRCQSRTTQWKQTANTEWPCALWWKASSTCPFKIYFSQLVGSELSMLAWAGLRFAVHVW